MIYDYNTKNLSFLKMAKELKDLGIKNYKFILTLYDSKLQGVDPFDPNLSLEMQGRIQKEVLINYWYYVREIVRIPSSGINVPYEVHRGNIASTFLQLKNINLIEVLPRQHYKTWSACSFYSWIYVFVAKNYNMAFSNKQLGDAQLNLKRVMDIVKLLPHYLKSHLNTKYDTDNINKIRINENNNSIQALSTGHDVRSADRLRKRTQFAVFMVR